MVNGLGRACRGSDRGGSGRGVAPESACRAACRRWRPGRQAGGGERSEAASASMKAWPGPAGGQLQCPAAGGAGEAAGERQQRRRRVRAVRIVWWGQADEAGPAQQVVRDGGQHCPGGVGVNSAGREVRQRLIFEVADRELDHGVLAVLGLDDPEWVGAVGHEREVPPVRQQLGLRADRAGRGGRPAVRPSVVSAICASPSSG